MRRSQFDDGYKIITAVCVFVGTFVNMCAGVCVCVGRGEGGYSMYYVAMQMSGRTRESLKTLSHDLREHCARAAPTTPHLLKKLTGTTRLNARIILFARARSRHAACTLLR